MRVDSRWCESPGGLRRSRTLRRGVLRMRSISQPNGSWLDLFAKDSDEGVDIKLSPHLPLEPFIRGPALTAFLPIGPADPGWWARLIGIRCFLYPPPLPEQNSLASAYRSTAARKKRLVQKEFLPLTNRLRAESIITSATPTESAEAAASRHRDNAGDCPARYPEAVGSTDSPDRTSPA